MLVLSLNDIKLYQCVNKLDNDNNLRILPTYLYKKIIVIIHIQFLIGRMPTS